MSPGLLIVGVSSLTSWQEVVQDRSATIISRGQQVHAASDTPIQLTSMLSSS